MALHNLKHRIIVNLSALANRIKVRLNTDRQAIVETSKSKASLARQNGQPFNYTMTRYQPYSTWKYSFPGHDRWKNVRFSLELFHNINNAVIRNLFNMVKLHKNLHTWNRWAGILRRYGSGNGGRKHNGGGNHSRGLVLSSAAVLSCAAGTNTEEKFEENCKREISSDEIETAVSDLKSVINLHKHRSGNQDITETSENEAYMDDWLIEWEGPAITIWSRPLVNKEFRQYKIYGRYDDIPAIAFFYVQTNLTHRKDWDTTTDEIEFLTQVGDDTSDGTELIYWRVNFPRLMAKRDYVFARRLVVDVERNMLAVVSRAVPHAETPINHRFVRVTDYTSKMVIKPHKSYTENGFEYVMTYIDDTKTKMPAYALKQLVRNVLPRFLETVHKESRIVMDRYEEWLAAGADTANCPQRRVRELHRIIELAECRRVSRQQQQAADLAEDARVTAAEEPVSSEEELLDKKPVKLVRIQKISPPAYLPDVKKYLHIIFTEGKFYPVPYKKVHSDSISSSGSRSKSKMSISHSYPNYDGGRYPSYSQASRASDYETEAASASD